MLDESNELAAWIFALHRTLLEDGFDADALMKKAGFDFDAITSTSEYISKNDAQRIWEEVERTTEDDAYCLKIIPFVSDTYLNSLVIAVQACESMDAAVRSLLKYYRLVDATSKITLSINKTACMSISNRCPDIHAPKQDIDLIFGLITKHAPTLMIDDIKPVLVKFARPEPKNKAAYEQYFPCPVLFNQNQNSIEFPVHLPSEIMPSANPLLWTHLEDYLTTRLQGMLSGGIADDVKREIIHLLPEGTPKLGDVAMRLNISERTLQRKLKHYGICFTALLNTTRVELAMKLLKEPKATIQTTAYQVGFSESGNFIRFFKQQTGKTPYVFVKEVTI